MFRRTKIVAAAACLLTIFSGCVELTQTITLNPDARGKMKIESIAPATFDLMAFAMLGAGEEKKPSIHEVRNNAAKSFLANSEGATAFKDVSATWLRDGRLQVVGTVYFDRLDDRGKKLDEMAKDLQKDPADFNPALMAGMFGDMRGMFSPSFQVSLGKGKEATMRIKLRETDDKSGGKQAGKGLTDALIPLNLFGDKSKSIDLAKMTDKEIEEYLLETRVAFAMIRPMMEGMFGNLKIKAIIHVPGDIGEVKGFQKDGPRNISTSIDGADLTKVMAKLMTMDAAEARKLAQSKDEKDLSAFFGSLGKIEAADVTVKNLGAPLFDYDKEVRDARAAYPALRKSLGLPDSFKLPGDGK